MNVPEDLLYTDTHEWIRRDGDKIRIGITDHAQAELTDVVVESVKAASDIYAPVKGTVLEVNKELQANPALVNTDPYGEGWIYVMQVDDPSQLAGLKDAAAYRASLG